MGENAFIFDENEFELIPSHSRQEMMILIL